MLDCSNASWMQFGYIINLIPIITAIPAVYLFYDACFDDFENIQWDYFFSGLILQGKGYIVLILEMLVRPMYGMLWPALGLLITVITKKKYISLIAPFLLS